MACALVPLASFAFYAFDQVTDQLERQAARRLESASKDAGMGLLERLLLLDTELRSVAAHLGRSASPALGASRREGLRERFEALWIAGRDGRPSASLLGEARSLQPLSEAERREIRRYEVLLRTVAKGSGAPAVVLVRPVETDGRAGTLLVGEARRDFLWRLVRGTGREGITVFDASGRVLASSLPAGARPPRPRAEAEPRALLEWPGADSLRVGASWRLFLASSFAAESWTVVRSEPQSWVLRPVRGFKRSFLLVTALALAMVALLSHAWIRRTLRPLQALREGALRVGRRDVAARVPVQGEDEFADVAQAFNHMALDLEQHFGALDRLLRIDQEILATSDASELAERVALHALSLCDCDAALVAAAGSHDGAEGIVYVATAAEGRSRRERGSAPAPRAAGAEVADLALAEEGGEELDPLRRIGMGHARVVRLVRDRTRLGLLALARESRAFGAEEPSAYVRQLADQTSAALAHLQERERNRVLAYYDALTGLPNRLMLHERLQQAILHGRGASSQAVCLLRLEGFRRVRATLEPEVRDELMRSVADRVRRASHTGDTFRLEGSEFGVLLRDLESPERVARVARSLLEAFRRPFGTPEGEVVLSARIGVAVHPQDGDEAERLERNARAALNSASEETPGRYRFYSPAMSERSRERLALETRLRQAIDREELDLAFHPIVSVDSREPVGAEVLLRWRRDGEAVSPEYFVPVAEEAGLMGELGGWVLRRSARMLSRWLAEGLPPLRLHVNVSGQQLQGEELYHELCSLLRETSLPPGVLGLEITESAVTDHGDATLDLLRRIRSLGVGLAIDDFGKGYSSMTQLRKLSVDTLKIDRSFLDRAHEDPADAAVVRAIVAMAHGLGLSVIAEGVEREEHLAFLREERCDDAQGFLFSEPLPPDAFRKYLREAAERPA